MLCLYQSDDAQLCDDSCEKQSTYQFLRRSLTFWAFVMQMTNEGIQCTVGGRDQVSEWQLKQKNHCTFLQVIKTQVQTKQHIRTYYKDTET